MAKSRHGLDEVARATKGLSTKPPNSVMPPEVPWWAPVDLEDKALKVGSTVMNILPRRTYEFLMKARAQGKMGERVRLNETTKRQLAADMAIAMMATEEFQHEWAKQALLNPNAHGMLVAKLMPKEVKMELGGTAKLAIVVPSTATPDQWNSVHDAKKELADGDWGIELSDTPFGGAVEGEVISEGDDDGSV